MGRVSLLLRASSALLVLMLGACGGGGGGGDAPPPDNPNPGLSGLVPTPPVPGTVLVADATALRPLIPGATWTYSGLETTTGASAPDIAYVNTVTHQANGQAQSVLEAATNVLNSGPAQQTVSHTGDGVRTIAPFDVGTGQPTALDQLELRSPVRVDDQYTTLDQIGRDLGTDLDGDGRNDTFDIAVYSRVLGQETLDLPNWPQATTVRVRLTVAIRIRGTRGQSATETATLDTWYAAGVGPVRVVSDVPGTVLGSRVLDTETLVTFDGVTRGVGYLASRPAASPTGTPQRFLVGAAAFDTHALMLTWATNLSVDGVSLSKVSSRGEVLSSQTIVAINPGNAQIVRFGNTVRILAIDDANDVRMWTFDSDGNPSGPSMVVKPGAVQDTATGEEFAVAATDAALWLSWIEGPTPPFGSPTQRAQPFDANGQAIASPSILGTLTSPGVVRNLRAAASSSHAIFAWNVNSSSAYAVMPGSASPVDVHFLNAGFELNMLPGATTTGANLLWRTNPGMTGMRLSGLTFDANDEPLRSTGGVVEQELLATPWVNNIQYVQTAGSRTAAQDIFLQDPGTTSFESYVVELTPGVGPLASNNQMRLLARGDFPPATRLVSLSNNVLLFTDLSAGVTITSVWRRP